MEQNDTTDTPKVMTHLAGPGTALFIAMGMAAIAGAGALIAILASELTMKALWCGGLVFVVALLCASFIAYARLL